MKSHEMKEIISAVRSNPEVIKHRNPTTREQIWQGIAGDLGLQVAEAKNKWHIIRERYVREHRLVSLGKVKKEDIKFPHYDLMDFLNPYIRRRNPNGINRKQMKNQKSNNRKSQRSETKIVPKKESKIDLYVASVDHFLDGGSSPEQKIPFVEEFVHNFEETNCGDDYVEDISIVNFKGGGVKSNGSINNYEKQDDPIPINQTEDADDLFCKMLSISLRSLSRSNNMRAKTEIFQILKKYVEIEENDN